MRRMVRRWLAKIVILGYVSNILVSSIAHGAACAPAFSTARCALSAPSHANAARAPKTRIRRTMISWGARPKAAACPFFLPRISPVASHSKVQVPFSDAAPPDRPPA